MAQIAGCGRFCSLTGDAHLQEPFDQAREQLQRVPGLPTLRINPDVTDLFAFRYDDFELVGYEAAPHIAAPVAV